LFDARDLTAQHHPLPPTLGAKANRIYVDHRLPARRRRASALDLTTSLTTTVTTVAVPTTPPTRPFGAALAWLLRLPAPGSVGVTGSRPVSSAIKRQVWRAAAQRKLRPAHDRRYRVYAPVGRPYALSRDRSSRLSSITCFSRSITALEHMAVSPMSFTTTAHIRLWPVKDSSNSANPSRSSLPTTDSGSSGIRRILLNAEKSGVSSGWGSILRA
jgi:hypothetical protein